jgi:hypothetical protein
MIDKSRGDMIPHIVLREIRAFPVPLPPLSEQHRIVAELTALESKIGTLESLQLEFSPGIRRANFLPCGHPSRCTLTDTALIARTHALVQWW